MSGKPWRAAYDDEYVRTHDIDHGWASFWWWLGFGTGRLLRKIAR